MGRAVKPETNPRIMLGKLLATAIVIAMLLVLIGLIEASQ